MKRTHLLSGLLGLMAVFVVPLFVLGAWGGSATVRVADAKTAALTTRQAPNEAHRSIRTEVERARAVAAAERREQKEAFTHLPGGVSPATLGSIAACESGGDPRIVSADGSYRGKYQFSYGTWESVGGKGDPAAAPEAEQDYRAALLYSRSGPSSWPVCG